MCVCVCAATPLWHSGMEGKRSGCVSWQQTKKGKAKRELPDMGERYNEQDIQLHGALHYPTQKSNHNY